MQESKRADQALTESEPPTREEFQKMCDAFLAQEARLAWIVLPGGGKNHVAAFELEQDAREFAAQKGYMAVKFGVL